uniref:Uncharacterized protein n=1 Tax=Magallana gigas TaxID=29159 RepID=K1QVR7_MAGGI
MPTKRPSELQVGEGYFMSLMPAKRRTSKFSELLRRNSRHSHFSTNTGANKMTDEAGPSKKMKSSSTFVLSKPNSAVADILGPESLSEANENVRKIIDTPNKSAEMPKTPGSEKREKYAVYSPRDRTAIGKFCAENGPVAAVRKFSKDFPSLSESGVRGMRKRYQESLVSRKRKLRYNTSVNV